MFGHHGSKAAGNMIGHLLSYDLDKKDIRIAMIHVSQFASAVLSHDGGG